ncbi:MAG TPA: hypothetical protein VI864_02795 [Candidatus Bathyarchaeia archaeon]|nr:hypothetical protein [Candidatus Bathyarchaeia archaeon]
MAVTWADWDRLRHYLEARFPELKKTKNQVEEVAVLDVKSA